MKKIYSEDELIQLAKLAPPVAFKAKGKANDLGYSTAESFLNETGIEAGRNEVDFSVIYNAYLDWAEIPMKTVRFKRELNKIIKNINEGIYKLNMKPITILEKVREMKKHDKEKEKFTQQE